VIQIVGIAHRRFKAVCGCGFKSQTYTTEYGAEAQGERHHDHTHHSWTYPKVVPYQEPKSK
jgi:hypothetical protein